jgi:hypothetical protein
MKARRLDLSYADAVGYVQAERLGVRFLTGDNAFKGDAERAIPQVAAQESGPVDHWEPSRPPSPSPRGRLSWRPGSMGPAACSNR